MNRKAISPESIMIYLLALIFGALILFYGYNSITSIAERGEKAMYLRFEQKLIREIDEIASLPGTIRIPEFTLPSKFNKICFFEFGKDCYLPKELTKDKAVVCDAVDNQVANVFLFPLQENDLKIPKIELVEVPLCIDIPSGFFKLQITGKGRSAVLSLPQ